MTLDIASPCRGICRIDEERQLCEGCLRTLDEIGRWSRMDVAQKRAVLSACLQRQLLDNRQTPADNSPD